MNDQKENAQNSGMGAQIAVYAASAIVSALTIWTTVRDSFYRHVSRSTKWYKDIRDVRSQQFDAIEHLTGETYQTKHKQISKAYSDAIVKINEGKGFSNSWEKFKFLNKNEKMKVAGIAVTVGAITMGAITNIRQNRQIKHQLEEMNRKSNEQGVQP